MTRLVEPPDVAHVLYPFLPLRALYGLARAHGRVTNLVARRQRATVRANLAGAVGATGAAADVDALTRRFFEYKAARSLLLALATQLTDDELERLLPVDGLEHLDAALELGRGVILLGSHLNSLTMFNAIIMLRRRGYDIGVALPEPDDPWQPSRFRARVARRRRLPSMYESTGAFFAQFNIRPIVSRLAANAIVAQTGDGLHSARFVGAPFLGRELPFPTGMAAVAQLTGAAIVPIFQVGAAPYRLRVVLEEPLTIEKGDDAEAALRAGVAAYARLLEHHLRENLACWEHWLIDDTLATIESWPRRPLEERYQV